MLPAHRQHLVRGVAAVNTGQRRLRDGIGVVLRSAREAQRLSQEQLADLTQEQAGGAVSRAMISAIERGQALPGLEALLSITAVLHVEPAEIFERIKLQGAAAPVDLSGVSVEDLRRRAEQLFWSGDYRSALTVYDTVLERLVLDPPVEPDARRRAEARIEIDRAVTYRECSALRAAEASAKRAVQLARGMSDLQAEAYMVLASLHSHEGFLDLASIEIERAASLAVNEGPRLQGQTWMQKGNILHRLKEYEEARQAFLQARRFALSARDYHDLVRIEGNIGACLFDLGRHAAAGKQFIKAVDLARKHADPAMEASWLVELGRLALHGGALDDADRYASAALRIAKPSEQVLTIFRAVWLQHLIAERRNPADRDRHRLAHLKRLYVRVRNHQGLDVIQEFTRTVLGASASQGDSDA